MGSIWVVYFANDEANAVGSSTIQTKRKQYEILKIFY